MSFGYDTADSESGPPSEGKDLESAGASESEGGELEFAADHASLDVGTSADAEDVYVSC